MEVPIMEIVEMKQIMVKRIKFFLNNGKKLK